MWTIYIYGSATDEGEFPLKSGLSGQLFYILNPEPLINYDDDNKQAVNGDRISKHKPRIGWRLKILPVRHLHGAGQTFESLFSTGLFKAKYHYIWLNDYPYYPSGHDSTHAVAVSIENQAIEWNHRLGLYQKSIDVVMRSQI